MNTETERQRLQAEMTRIEQQMNALQERIDALVQLHADTQAQLNNLDEHEVTKSEVTR